MKHIFQKLVVVLALLPATMVASAQENNNRIKTDAGIQLGGTKFMGPPSPWLVHDNDNAAFGFGLNAHVGLMLSCLDLRLTFGQTNLVEFNDESARMTNVGAEFLLLIPTAQRWKPTIGIGAAAAHVHNEYSLSNESFELNRWGMLSTASIGLRYFISDAQYSGVNYQMFHYQGLQDKEKPLPAGYMGTLNSNRSMVGTQLSIQYGVEF